MDWDLHIIYYNTKHIFLDCSELPSTPDNGTANGTSVTHGSIVTYSCDQEYTLVGSDTVTCFDGSWNDTSPVCFKGTRLIIWHTSIGI